MTRRATNVAILSLVGVFILTVIVTPNSDVQTFASKSGNQLEQIPSEPTDFPGSDPSAIQVDVTSASESSIGSYHIRGAIKNLGDIDLEGVRVTGFFYDDDNKTVGVTSCCSTDPSTIEPGRTATFDSFAQEEEVSGIPTSFRLSLDWR